MTGKTKALAANTSAGSFAETEKLLKRLEGRVGGYPRDLALLVRLATHLEKRMVEVSNALLKPHGLSYSMYQVLVICLGSEAAPPMPSELAEALGERATNITHLCDELEKRQLALRQRDSADRRRIQMVLTPAGRALLSELQPAMWEIWQARYKGSTQAERKLVLESMRRQYQHLGGL
jgi:MarR family transcriptional repressor of emrRAB